MASKTCMNELCRTTTSPQWKKGWGLKSGRFATLCYNCGYAYETLVFCETFHLEESGWRDCRICGKRIHCGCIASRYLHDYLEFGGVACITCAKHMETQSMRPILIPGDDIPNGFSSLRTSDSCNPKCSVVENRISASPLENGRIIRLCKSNGANEPGNLFHSQKGDTDTSSGQLKQEKNVLPHGEVSRGFSSFLQQPVGPPMYAKADNSRPKQGVEDMFELLAHPSLSFSLSTPDNSNSVFPFSGDIIEGREQSKVPSFQQGQRTRHITPKPSKNGHGLSSETNKGLASEARIARPPAEVQGRPQLLPRYWPKITDQELRQLSGDLNSTILPLFEKVLSASDAGRIGRLVLPKACAEAYFPTISQSEGVPIKIQDVKGKEWTFQFRFWPNNNSRMYVLEGVTPCIQNMQLQAGDTVMFSRIDPGGNLVMGFRKATSNTDIQDAQTYTIPNGGFPGETSDSGVNDDLPIHGAMTNEDSLPQSTPILEKKKKKKTRNIASKNKRLLMHSEDAMMLRITREEAQELFRPPPTVKPTIVVIEDHDFEEYYEPPVFGKRTIFTAQPSGEQEQWAQCDGCSKWRKLPVDALLPPKWTCLDNIWDLKRCSCSEPEEIKPKVIMDSILQVGKELKKRRIAEKNKVAQECEPSGLDALATAAVLGENVGDSIEFSVGATTTKHPRHRPGCSCIVCIQPPSGKGRHKPTCVCNVCLTVKRRFKTLMLRKKKRQSEREAELVLGKGKLPATDGSGTDTAYGQAFPLPFMNQLEDERSQREIQTEEMPGCSNGQLDLNCDPDREDDMLTEAAGMSISSLLHAAGLPLESLEMYFRQGGLASFGPGQATCNGEGQPSNEGCLAATNGEQENKGGEV